MLSATSAGETAISQGRDLINMDMSTQNQVEWRDIPGYEGLYQISNDGRVFSMPRKRTRKDGSEYFIPGRELKVVNAPTVRYPYIGLWKEGSMRIGRIHQLVLLAFVGPRPDGMLVCHRDDNPRNNRLENLRYDTPRGNAQDVVKRRARRKGASRCMAGHALTPKNVEVWGTGNRICLPCQRGDAPILELPESIFKAA